MLEYEYMAKHFDASKVFQRIQEKTGKDVEGDFMSQYEVANDSAVRFYIPDCSDEYDEIEDCEKLVAMALLEAGCTDGEVVYLDFCW